MLPLVHVNPFGILFHFRFPEERRKYMTSDKGLRLIKDIATVVLTFTLLTLLALSFLWVVLTSIRPKSELFSEKFQLLTPSIYWIPPGIWLMLSLCELAKCDRLF